MKTSCVSILLCAPIVMLSLCSCNSNRTVNKEKLISYVEHSETLTQSQEVKGIKIKMSYCPSELLMIQELESGSAGGPKKLSDLKEKYGRQYYFRLSFSKNNQEAIRELGSYQRYSDMLQVLSFELGKYVNASSDRSDTISMNDYSFEQQYGMSGANSALLVFNRNEFEKSERISINLGEFGLGIGDLHFDFRRADLEQLPMLDYSNINR